MRGALNVPMMKDPEVLDKLDYKCIYGLCVRYEEHLKVCAEAVSTEQNNLAARIREVVLIQSFQYLNEMSVCKSYTSILTLD